MKRKHKRQVWALLMTLFMLITTVAGDIPFAATAYASEVQSTEIAEENPNVAAAALAEEEIQPLQDELVSAEPGTITSTANVRSSGSAGTSYTVKGTVTDVSGKTVYIQDETGGMCLRFSANVTGITAGQVITATGKYEDFNGLIELSGVVEADCTVEEGTVELPVADKTIAEILTDDDTANGGTRALQGTRVRLSGVTLGAQDGNYIPITQTVDSTDYTIKLFKATLPDTVKAGDKVDIIGIVGCYNGAQIVCVTAANVTLVEEASYCLPVEASVAAGAVESGTEVTLSCKTAGASIYYNTDGSTNYTEEYTTPISITTATTIYAVAKKDNWTDSAVASFAYTIADPVQKKTVGTLTKTVGDGDTVVLYYPVDGMLLTTTASGKKLSGVSASSSAGEIILPDGAAKLTVSVNADGYYTFSCDGKYLTSGATGDSLSFTDTATNYSLWNVEAVNDSGLFYVKNVNAVSGTKVQSLEYYSGGFTTYGHKDTAAYQFQFYTLSEKEVVDPVIANGTYVIYNSANKVALSSVYTGYYNSGVTYDLNASGSFDNVKETEVWTIESKVDGSVVISQDGNRLSMDTSNPSTPLNKVHDTWTLTSNGDGTYYIENIGRSGYKIEWYASKNNFSTYTSINGSEGLFKMSLIPVSESQIEEVPDEVREQTIPDGNYFIYSSGAEGVMKYDLTGGVAAKIAATVTSDNKADFGEGTGEGAGVYTFEWKADKQAYVIKLGSQYLGTNSSKEIILTDEASTANRSYWLVEWNDEFGGYTIGNSNSSTPYYLEYYGSKGFCLWTASTITDIYVFSLLDATGVANDDGYVGTKPVPGVKPESGKSYTIYNASGKSVVGPAVTPIDGASASMGAANATELEDGSLKVANGGLIFTVTTEDDYYIFANNGKYLATNDDEELFLQDTLDDHAKWSLEDLSGGFLIKNKTANYKGTPVVLEYFSGGFAGYTFKAIDADIFRFEFRECEDTYGTGYVVNPEVVFQTDASANWGINHVMKFVLDDLGTVQSVTAKVVFEDNTAKTYSPVMEGYDGTVTIPAADLQGHTSAKLTISVVSAESDTRNAEYNGTADIEIKDEPVITAVSPAANAQTGSNKKPVIKVSFANIGANATAEMTLNGDKAALTLASAESAYTYTPVADMADGKYTAVVTITRADGKTVTKTWSFFVGTEGVQLFFGQIHSHTGEYSDGSGTLEQAYEYAMSKAADTDYMIVTDHSNYFDTTASATKDSIYDDAADSIAMSTTVDASGNTLNLWQEAKATAEYYDGLSTDFVAGYGYEMTWSGGPGHINVFNSKGIVSRNNTELNNKTNNAGMLAFYDLLVDADEKDATSTGTGNIIAQFNHPGTTFGFFDSFTGWEESRDSVMNMIEVGNGDGAIGGTAYFPSYEYYDMCLSTGWHVAPTNGQDNHKGSWGDSNTARTVVLTDTFTEEGIYEAMSARHIYSTEDQNLSVLYYLDETLQGGIIEGYDKDTVELAVSLSDADNEELGYVYVIGENGAVLYTSDYLIGNTADLSITLDNTSAYYYVKIVEKDGDIAVTAPVWVDDVNSGKAKVKATLTSESEATGAYPVEGNKEMLTLNLNNREDSAITIVSYSLTVDGETVASEVVNETVAAGAGYQTSYDWTPASYGTHKVVASFVITVNGETSTVTVSKNIYVAGTDYNTVRTVREAKAGAEKEEFTVEGYVTANASGYDKNTAFFDCIYVQDDTAGINVFPVAGEFRVGQKVRVHGAITYYNGEIELNISSDYGGYIEIIDENVTNVAPKLVSCKDAMSEENIGLLMQISGTVSRIHEASGVVDRIYVEDASGQEACVYINGYIWNSVTKDMNFGTVGTTVKLGDKVSVIGLGSVDVDELGEVEYLHRLRVRDRAEINVLEDTNSGDTPEENPGDTNPGDTPEENPGNTNPGDTPEENPGDTNSGDTNPGDTNSGDANPGENNPGSTASGSQTNSNSQTGGMSYSPVEGAVILYDGNSTTESSIADEDNRIIRRLHNGLLQVEGSGDVLPSGARIFVSHVLTGQVAENVRNAVQNRLAGVANYVVYEIDLFDSWGVKLEQLSGNVTVTLPIPEGISIGEGQTLVVYRMESDGSLTRLKTTVTDGKVTFITNHFSTYIFAVQNTSAIAPTTGDTNANRIFMAMMLLVFGSALLAYEGKKRRRA